MSEILEAVGKKQLHSGPSLISPSKGSLISTMLETKRKQENRKISHVDVKDYFGEHARKTDAAMHNCTLHKADGDEFLWCWAPLSLVGPVSLFDPLSLVVPVPLHGPGPGLYPWLAPHCPFGEPSPWVRALKLRAPGTCMLPKVLIIL